MIQASGGLGPIGGTWDPAKKGGNIGLSGGNLIATKNTDDAWYTVLGTVAAGGRQCSFSTVSSVVSANAMVGIGNASAGLSTYLGSAADNTSIGYFASGAIRINGVDVATGLATWLAGGDTIETVIDDATKMIYWKKNGVLVTGSLQSYSAITGAVYAGCSLFTNGESITGNFS